METERETECVCVVCVRERASDTLDCIDNVADSKRQSANAPQLVRDASALPFPPLSSRSFPFVFCTPYSVLRAVLVPASFLRCTFQISIPGLTRQAIAKFVKRARTTKPYTRKPRSDCEDKCCGVSALIKLLVLRTVVPGFNPRIRRIRSIFQLYPVELQH